MSQNEAKHTIINLPKFLQKRSKIIPETYFSLTKRWLFILNEGQPSVLRKSKQEMEKVGEWNKWEKKASTIFFENEVQNCSREFSAVYSFSLSSLPNGRLYLAC